MDIVITWRELLIAVALGSAVYLIETLVLSRRRGAGGQVADASVREELAELRRQLADLRHRLDSATEAGNDKGALEPAEPQSAYDYAVQYAREGLEAQEIAERCRISRDEAALIAAMSRRGLDRV